MANRIGAGGPFLIDPAPFDHPALVDDDNAGWWSGAQLNFVAIPKAFGVLALSASVAVAGTFTHSDEPPAQIPSDPAPTESSATLRASARPVFQRWTFTDDEPVVVPFEDDWTAPPAPLVPAKVWVCLETDEIAPSIRDEDGWTPPSIRSAIAAGLPWLDDDYVPPPSGVVAEDDAFPVMGVLSRSPVAPAFLSDDDIVPVGASAGPADSDGFTQRARATTVWQQWAATDDLPTTAPSFFGDEEWFQPWSRPVPPVLLVWATTDEIPSVAPSVFGDDEPRPVLPVLAPALRPWIAWGEDDYVPALAPGDDTSWGVATMGTDLVPKVFAADDDLPIAAGPTILDEDYWWTRDPVLLPPKTLPTVDGDAIFAAAVLESDWQVWTPPLVAPKPLYGVLWAEDELCIAPVPPAVEEDYWWTRDPYLPPPRTIVWVDGDAIFKAAVVEAEWQVWTPPLVPAKPIYAPDTDAYIVPQPPITAIADVIFVVQADNRVLVVAEDGRMLIVSPDGRVLIVSEP